MQPIYGVFLRIATCASSRWSAVNPSADPPKRPQGLPFRDMFRVSLPPTNRTLPCTADLLRFLPGWRWLSAALDCPCRQRPRPRSLRGPSRCERPRRRPRPAATRRSPECSQGHRARRLSYCNSSSRARGSPSRPAPRAPRVRTPTSSRSTRPAHARTAPTRRRPRPSPRRTRQQPPSPWSRNPRPHSPRP